MMRLYTWVDNARRRCETPQDGFALPGTLAVLLFSSLVVTALLGLTFATGAFSADQIARDDQTRAADSAINTAIGRIAGDATAVSGSMDDDEWCGWEPGAGETAADRPTLVVDAHGEQVEVTCEAESPDVYVPEEEIADRVLVVGEYEGAPVGSANRLTSTQWRNTTPEGTPCLVTSANCFPWREAAAAADSASLQPSPTIGSLLGQLGAAGTRASIAHTGIDPLRFIGDVQARHGAVALRNERENGLTGTYSPGGPGVSASGSIVQGSTGLMAEIAPVPAGECGLLRRPAADLVRPYQIQGAQAEALDGVTCESEGAASLDPVGSRLSRPRDAAGDLLWTSADVQGRLAAAPVNGAGTPLAWSGSCPPMGAPATRLVRFAPGSYTKDRTEVLNQWFANCNNAVFHFQPGAYWFDVDRSGAFFADGGSLWSERHALLVDNPNNRVVFGAPRGWNNWQGASTAAAPICNPDAAGVSITLSPRTSIVHRRGLVNICGVPPSSPSAQPQATIWQDSSPDLGVSEGATSASGGVATQPFRLPSFREIFAGIFLGQSIAWFGGRTDVLRNPSTLQPTDQVPFRVDGNCALGSIFGISIPNVACNGSISYAMPFAGPDGTNTADASLSSAVVTVRADSLWGNGGAARTIVDLYSPSRPDVVACTATFPRIPEGMNGSGPLVVAYDLMNPRSGNCGSYLRQPDVGRESLLNSIVVVTHQVDVEWGRNFWLRVDEARMRTGWSPSPASPATCSIPTGGRLRNSCSNAPSVTDPSSSVWSEIRVNRQALRVPRILFIPSWELRYWPSGDTTVTYTLPTLDDRFNPNLATDPGSTLTSAGVLLEGRSRCSIIGIDCGAYGIANRDNAGLRVQLVNSNGTVHCSTNFRRLPEWGETRYLDLLAAPGGNVESGNCHSVLNGARNEALLGRSLRVDLNLKPRVPCLPPSNNSGILDILASLGTLGGLLCNWWGYDVGRIQIMTSSLPGSTDPNAAYSGPRTPMRVTSDRGQTAQFTMYGPLSIPGNDLDVRWSGAAPQGTLFSGYSQNQGNAITTMVVRGIGSDTVASNPADPDNTPATRILCCFDARAGERIVELRAWIGRPSGASFDPEHLRTIATVRIVDRVPIPADDDPPPPAGSPQPGTYQAANRVIIDDWQVCTRADAGFACRVV